MMGGVESLEKVGIRNGNWLSVVIKAIFLVSLSLDFDEDCDAESLVYGVRSACSAESSSRVGEVEALKGAA